MINNIVALAATTAIYVAIPGPNVAMIVANSIRLGTRFGFITVAGTTTGVALQLMLITSGFAALLSFASSILPWIKWAGVIYLLYLGIKTWRAPARSLVEANAIPEPASKLFWRGMMLAIVNPNALVFNAAFLPQFADSTGNPAIQMTILGATFLFILTIGDAVWAVAAGCARSYLRKYGGLRNKITGGFLTASGIGLALARH